MKDCQNMDHYSKLKHDYEDLYSIFYEYFSYIFQSLVVETDGYTCMLPRYTPGMITGWLLVSSNFLSLLLNFWK